MSILVWVIGLVVGGWIGGSLGLLIATSDFRAWMAIPVCALLGALLGGKLADMAWIAWTVEQTL